jgi:hypothetical protein
MNVYSAKLLSLFLSLWYVAFIPNAARCELIPRPEHPRPDAIRAEWLNLNGPWEFAETNEDETSRFLSGAPYSDTIVVPFCREAPASGIERREFVKNVWYRRAFSMPNDWKSPRVRLHVGACDWKTRVWVNGTLVGIHTGGNSPFAFDVTDVVRKTGNQVVIHAFDDTASGLQPLGKQSIRGESWAIFYTPTTGIWQTVWLDGVGETFIKDVRLGPDPEGQCIRITASLSGPPEGLHLIAEVSADGRAVGTAEVRTCWRDNRMVVDLSEKRLWSPSDPFLYDVKFVLKRGDETVDELLSYFGLRHVCIVGAAILINNQPIFQRLILDQGFYPKGIWTAPTDEALKKDIELSMACGFNGARLHQKVFEPRFLYWADKLGYLVWGEYPSYGANYSDPRVNLPIVQEWNELVARDRNHPSIIGWCPFNETPGDAGPLQETVLGLTRQLDPSRPVIETSGWTHTVDDPEVLDAHDYHSSPDAIKTQYGQPVAGLPERYGITSRPGLPFMISEFGGIGYDLKDSSWGYGSAPQTKDEFHKRFDGVVKALLDTPTLFGFCYTQLTDIEQECNGLYYYDRRPKFDVKRVHDVVSRAAAYEKTPPTTPAEPAPMEWTLLIGSFHDEHLCWSWWHTTEKPTDDWAQPGFPFWTWTAGRPPYGKKEGEWERWIRTPWTTPDIWLRQDAAYDGKPFDKAVLVIHHDNEVEVLVGGQPLWGGAGWNDQYEAFDVTEAARANLKPGLNAVAAHVHQDGGGQYFDMALLIGLKRDHQSPNTK